MLDISTVLHKSRTRHPQSIHKVILIVRPHVAASTDLHAVHLCHACGECDTTLTYNFCLTTHPSTATPIKFMLFAGWTVSACEALDLLSYNEDFLLHGPARASIS